MEKCNRNKSGFNWLYNWRNEKHNEIFFKSEISSNIVNRCVVQLCKNSSRLFSLPYLALNITADDAPRQERHLIYTFPQSPVRASWAGGEGYTCITSRGILGSCQSFRNCYPFFKVPTPVLRYPVLNAWDTWVLGNYDTCSYYTDDGRQAHGVCCTNPITPTSPPVKDETEQNEQNKIDFPLKPNNQIFGSWPPPVKLN